MKGRPSGEETRKLEHSFDTALLNWGGPLPNRKKNMKITTSVGNAQDSMFVNPLTPPFYLLYLPTCILSPNPPHPSFFLYFRATPTFLLLFLFFTVLNVWKRMGVGPTGLRIPVMLRSAAWYAQPVTETRNSTWLKRPDGLITPGTMPYPTGL